MIVPPSLATAQPTSPLGASNDNAEPPSLANMLMAASEMHRMGRLKGKKAKPEETAA